MQKPSIFQKIAKAGEIALDQYMAKARSEIARDEEDAYYQKAVTRDMHYSSGSQGYHEKAARLSFDLLKQMSLRDMIVASVIFTRQDQIAAFARPSKDDNELGFRIRLKDEKAALQKLKEEMYPESLKTDERKELPLDGDPQENYKAESTNREIDRRLKEELSKTTEARKKELQEFLRNCGKTEDRAFESQKWGLESFLRAFIRDSLAYDWVAVEKIRNEAGELHNFVPVDAATIRYASPELSKYKSMNLDQASDILYPEKELEKLAESDALNLDEQKLEDESYKYVQVIKGKIVRAFIREELSVGMRNPTTDIYANNYSISELELLIRIVSSHLMTENHEISFFTQGFSAKGVLHIKSPLNRRKLETLRTQWRHMVSGNRNSFQTPILAGMDEVKWIPLNQSHSDMEFSNWMNYLIKIICSIYRIDPLEIGFGMKDEGGSGGNLGGDNTEEKLEHSKDKGLVPLLRFVEAFINKNIMSELDENYVFEFTGVSEESTKAALERQEKEVMFKKSVNEIREESGLPPIPGADHLLLHQTYFQWWSQAHPEGQQMALDNQRKQMELQQEMFPEDQAGGDDGQVQKSFRRFGRRRAPVKIEYYEIPED